jgi:ATP-dependent Clp protease ATP-binding subunit ClpB
MPKGVFFFVGPTGVGKTELSKALAKFLFGDEQACIRFDMSEYAQENSDQKLIGAAPGYVGYEEGGQLTEKVRRSPYSIVLFDEIEKAHPDVFNILLQILDDGRLTDSQGRTVDFKNTIIIMTSNIGSSILLSNDSDKEEQIDRLLKSSFKPEFLNRIDEIIRFNPLGKNVQLQIVNKMLKELNMRLISQGLDIYFADSLKKWILDSSYDEEFGARPIHRFITKTVETFIATEIISGHLKPQTPYVCDVVDNKIRIINR